MRYPGQYIHKDKYPEKLSSTVYIRHQMLHMRSRCNNEEAYLSTHRELTYVTMVGGGAEWPLM
jgi:hypothetical protein